MHYRKRLSFQPTPFYICRDPKLFSFQHELAVLHHSVQCTKHRRNLVRESPVHCVCVFKSFQCHLSTLQQFWNQKSITYTIICLLRLSIILLFTAPINFKHHSLVRHKRYATSAFGMLPSQAAGVHAFHAIIMD